jgi:hypothetical protein
LAKQLTGLPLVPNPANVTFTPRQGAAWRGFASSRQPRSPGQHAARAIFHTASQEWANLEPDTQSAWNSLAAASAGRFNTGFGLHTLVAINAGGSWPYSPPSTYIDGGYPLSYGFAWDPEIGLQVALPDTTSEVEYFFVSIQTRVRPTQGTFTYGKATQIPHTFLSAGFEQTVDAYWPTASLGAFPPYGQTIVGWFTPLTANYISGVQVVEAFPFPTEGEAQSGRYHSQHLQISGGSRMMAARRTPTGGPSHARRASGAPIARTLSS